MPDSVKVWDPLVRVFHWSLVILFTVAYLSGDDWLDIHVFAGYGVVALVLFRLLWGLVGTRYARFTDFVRGPRTVVDYLKALGKRRAPRYLGHNPAGGAMVVALLAALLLSTLFGMAAYAAEEGAGPMVGFILSGHFWEEVYEGGHEFLVNLTLTLVIVHIFGVFISSALHGENLPRAMLTGRKPREP